MAEIKPSSSPSTTTPASRPPRSTPSPPRGQLRRRGPRADRRRGRRRAPRAPPRQIAGVAKVLHADGEQLRPRPGRERRRAGARARRRLQPHPVPGHRAGKNVAPRVAAKLDVGQISDITKVDRARHLRAADLRRQRDRHGAEPRPGQGHHRAHDRLRSGAGERRLGARSRPCSAVGDSGKSSFVGARDRQERPAGAHRRPRSSSPAGARWARATSSTRC